MHISFDPLVIHPSITNGILMEYNLSIGGTIVLATGERLRVSYDFLYDSPFAKFIKVIVLRSLIHEIIKDIRIYLQIKKR